jgi:hypothetical protein
MRDFPTLRSRDYVGLKRYSMESRKKVAKPQRVNTSAVGAKENSGFLWIQLLEVKGYTE